MAHLFFRLRTLYFTNPRKESEPKRAGLFGLLAGSEHTLGPRRSFYLFPRIRCVGRVNKKFAG
jgi:hypothetical protein